MSTLTLDVGEVAAVRLLATIVLLMLSVTVALSFFVPEEQICRERRISDRNYVVCLVDLRSHRLRMFWKGDDGVPFGSLSAFVAGKSGEDVQFAMNGGMYDRHKSPVGLYVEDGKEVNAIDLHAGTGNFFLKPNGVLYVSGTTVGIMESDRYAASGIRPDFATQSGPLLLDAGRLNPNISEHGTSRKIRNGVGVQSAHQAVFLRSSEPVTFFEFANAFKDDFDCDSALFLDGTISSVYDPHLHFNRIDQPAGPIIAAFGRGDEPLSFMDLRKAAGRSN